MRIEDPGAQYRDICEGTGWTGGHMALYFQPYTQEKEGIWGEDSPRFKRHDHLFRQCHQVSTEDQPEMFSTPLKMLSAVTNASCLYESEKVPQLPLPLDTLPFYRQRPFHGRP